MREDKVKIKKINSIMFQISTANVAILVAFVIVMAFVMISNAVCLIALLVYN